MGIDLTKQHYVLDVIAGFVLAFVAYVLFLRWYRDDEIPESDRRLAPAIAIGLIGILGIVLVCCWGVYRIELA